MQGQVAFWDWLVRLCVIEVVVKGVKAGTMRHM